MSSINLIEPNRTQSSGLSSTGFGNRTQSNRIDETRSIPGSAIRRLDAIDPGIERKFWYSYKTILSDTKCCRVLIIEQTKLSPLFDYPKFFCEFGYVRLPNQSNSIHGLSSIKFD